MFVYTDNNDDAREYSVRFTGTADNSVFSQSNYVDITVTVLQKTSSPINSQVIENTAPTFVS